MYTKRGIAARLYFRVCAEVQSVIDSFEWLEEFKNILKSKVRVGL